MFKPWEAGYLARTCLCPQNRSGASSDSSYSPERDKRTAGMTGLGRETLGTGERRRCGVTSRPSMGTKGPLSFPLSLCPLDWICVFIPLPADRRSPSSPFIDTAVSLTSLNPFAYVNVHAVTQKRGRLGALVDFPKISAGS